MLSGFAMAVDSPELGTPVVVLCDAHRLVREKRRRAVEICQKYNFGTARSLFESDGRGQKLHLQSTHH